MTDYDIPHCLRRKPRRRLLSVELMVCILAFIVLFIALVLNWDALPHAHAQGFVGVVKGSTFYTPQQFCDTL